MSKLSGHPSVVVDLRAAHEDVSSAGALCARRSFSSIREESLQGKVQEQQCPMKYSALGAGQGLVSDDKELDQFMTHYVLLLCSLKDQLQRHVRVHAMEALMACWEIEQSLQSLTGIYSSDIILIMDIICEEDDPIQGHINSSTQV